MYPWTIEKLTKGVSLDLAEQDEVRGDAWIQGLPHPGGHKALPSLSAVILAPSNARGPGSMAIRAFYKEKNPLGSLAVAKGVTPML